uniref:Uncharacterized protein n=1 Tax=Hyaloperonospora arabidopsidis (strain Emoy2) TaxID=559515 RepID=M4BP04_HYAAE
MSVDRSASPPVTFGAKNLLQERSTHVTARNSRADAYRSRKARETQGLAKCGTERADLSQFHHLAEIECRRRRRTEPGRLRVFFHSIELVK